MSYDLAFYQAETQVTLTSAHVVLPRLVEPGDYIADIGCGTGGWAWTAQQLGCTVVGVDWQVPTELQLVPIVDWDLTAQGWDCDGYDLAICLEVAEHLPEDAGPSLIAGLAGATRVLFSAATPGQPGVNHINCQPHWYWHDQFERYGLHPEHLGPLFTEPVADFYRRNMYLYERPA